MIEYSAPLLSILLAIWIAPPVHNGAARNIELYRKPLQDGQELVVVKGPLRSAARFRAFVRPEAAPLLENCFTLSVQLVSDEAPVVIWSKLYWSRDSSYEEMRVRDLLVAPGRVIVATSYSNRDIRLTQIGLAHEPDWNFSLKDWSAVPIWPAPGTLDVKLGYNEQRERVEIEVVHEMVDFRLRSLYHEQRGEDGSVKFVQVSREGTRLPATVPSATQSAIKRGT